MDYEAQVLQDEQEVKGDLFQWKNSGQLMPGSNFVSTQQFWNFMRAAKRHFFRIQDGDSRSVAFHNIHSFTVQ